MKVTSTILFYLIAICAFAQSETTFSVAKKKKAVIECQYDTLAGNSYYYFKVFGVSPKEIIPGKFAGGQVWMNDTAVCIHTSATTSPTKKYLLELFLKKDNSVIFSRNFTIVPQASIDYTPGALTIFRQQPEILLDMAGNSFGNKASSKDSLQGKVEKQLALLTPRSLSHSRITSKLKIDFMCHGKTTTLNTEGLKLSGEMITTIKAMDADCYLILYTTYHSFNDPPEDSNAGPYRFDIR